MRVSTIITIFVVTICCFLTIGCKKHSMAPKNPDIEESPIVGKWLIASTNMVPTTTIELTDDFRFKMMQNEDTIGEGQYYVTGNQLLIQNDGDTSTGNCTMSGTYSFTLSDDTLKFDRVLDDICDSRVDIFAEVWSKQP